MRAEQENTLALPIRPPWRPPSDLPPLVPVPPMSDRDGFISFAQSELGDSPDAAGARWDAAGRLIADGDIAAPLRPGRSVSPGETRALAAWLLTPRESFMPADGRSSAYAPHAFPIGHDQTISAPYMVSRMTSVLNPVSDDKVLEVGTGSGYQAAMLAVLSRRVCSIETQAPLAESAARRLGILAGRRPWLADLKLSTGSGYSGWEEEAPFDAIIITCAIDHLPPALLAQCAPGGVIIVPLGGPRVQRLLAFHRRPDAVSEGSGRNLSGLPGSWLPARDLPVYPDGSAWEYRDVYGDGSRVAFVPFVH